MKVLKFGGTSVGSPKRIREIINIIKDLKDIVVVVSAFGGITDQLIEAARLAQKNNPKYLEELKAIEKRHLESIKELLAKQKHATALKRVKADLQELREVLQGIHLIREVSPRTMDLIMSFGERLSSYIVAQAANALQLDTRSLIKTDNNFNNARVQMERTYRNIKEYFAKNKSLHIATGFIGSTDEEETTTLGRGGSDYTASILGAALDAKEIQIWTDVDGIMTADPRKAKKAFTIPEISYQEAMEMSHFGAKVIHPPTMLPALNKNIPIRIKNTMNPDFSGSVISNKGSKNEYPIKGVSSINNISLLTLQGAGMVGIAGIAQRLFGSLARQGISIILITQASSEQSITFAIKPEESTLAEKAINEEFALEIEAKKVDPVSCEDKLSVVAIVGENMRHSPGTAGKMFNALGKNGINVIAIAQGSSELNISTVIPQEDEAKAINALHDTFFLSGTKSINIFLVGTGLIGATLLKQIDEQSKFLALREQLDLNIVATANSKKMFWHENGKIREEKMDTPKFISKMAELNLPNSVFVDCTASEEITKHYESILKESISIVTPNKKANSGSYKEYQKLKATAAKHNIKFLYETNVGAGLPVLSTLNDLRDSGDMIEKIEAVLSGTLSYIFNSFDGSKPFSSVVKEAQEKGYTEPDPRDDLNGLDVARKILILARESGLELELKDIEVENLVPQDCRSSKSVDEFFVKLKNHDLDYKEKQEMAQKEGKKLCYIANMERKNKSAKVQVKLEAVNSSHPFSSLSGSDNIISFTTARYHDRPLVIKGPGAGAEVTAAGVFADIIRIAGYLS